MSVDFNSTTRYRLLKSILNTSLPNQTSISNSLQLTSPLTFIRMTLKILTVIGLATFEVYAAIPAGFAFKLPSLVIGIASTVGGLIGVFVAAYLGNQIKKLIAKYRKPKHPAKPKTGLIIRIWEKYGVIGLGFLGTLTVGAPISIGVGVGFNVPVNKMVVWCSIGVIVRCALFTTLGHYGTKLL